MKKTRILKSWSKHNLPDELWPDILSWLPVKSLLRFRCVSRSWKLIIDDSDFARLHLNRFNNRHESRFFFMQGGYCECVVKNNTTLRTNFSLGFLQSDPESAHILRTTPDRTGRCKRWSIVSSIDGLFMLSSTDSSSDLMLWNPSLGKTLTLPPSPAIDALLVNVDFGLGFDPSIQDYKLVRFVVARPRGGVRFAAVYTLGANSWKSIEFQGEFCQDIIFCYGKISIPLNGVLYALATDEVCSPMKLASFDLRSEAFASFELPVIDHSEMCTYHQALTVADDGCSLALVGVSERNGSIWVLERLGNDIKLWSWIQRYSFVLKEEAFHLKFLFLKKNGEMLLKYDYWVVCYNLDTQQEKIMLLKNKKEFNKSETYPYTESLILHH